MNFLKFIKRNCLPISVFITGACVLVVEVTATRVLSPHYGNTMFTVSSVISVILAALSIGYHYGGKLADKHPSYKWFFGIISASGIVLLFFHLLAMVTLPVLSSKLSVMTGPLISSIALFMVPALLLGTLSPFAVKLQTLRLPKEGIGSVAGNMFFWSTFGSITGSLMAGFALIPLFGVNQILIGTSAVLFLLGFVPLALTGFDSKRQFKMVAIFALVFAMTFTTARAADATGGQVLYKKDGLYEKIIIQDGDYSGRPARFFQQDRSSSGAMYLDTNDPTDMVYGYTKYYSIYKAFIPQPKQALFIGGGAFSMPKAIMAEQPDVHVTVSEIEPSLYGLAKQYFNVKDSPRLTNSTVDGRRLMRDSQTNFDYIFSDVYYSLYSVPAHFTTQEFFRTAKDKLNKDGIFVASMIGDLSRKQPSLIMSEIKTFQSVFPNSYFFAVDSPGITSVQNIIFVGYNGDKKVDVSQPEFTNHPDPTVRNLHRKVIDPTRFELSPYPLLTDNYSPVEFLTAEVLRRRQPKLLDGQEMLALIEQQLRLGPRHASAPGNKKLQDLIKAELKAMNVEVTTQTFNQKDEYGNVQETTNVIGRLHPEQQRRFVVGTHYDTKKVADKDSRNPDKPVPGANDGASGVAVILETARAFLLEQKNKNIGVDVVFFGGEEGFETMGSNEASWVPLGSTYFAKHLDQLYPVKPESGVIVDMVCKKNMRLLKESSSLQAANKQVEDFWKIGTRVGSRFFSDTQGPHINDDHTPLNQAGVPTFLVIDFDYPYHHTTQDTADKCNADSLHTVSQALSAYLHKL